MRELGTVINVAAIVMGGDFLIISVLAPSTMIFAVLFAFSPVELMK